MLEYYFYVFVYDYNGIKDTGLHIYHEYGDYDIILTESRNLSCALEKFWNKKNISNSGYSYSRRNHKNWFKIKNIICTNNYSDVVEYTNNYWENEPPRKRNFITEI